MYAFKLQAVLDHRRFLEDNLKKELSAIRRQLTEARQTVRRLEEKEMMTAAELKKEQKHGLASNQVATYHTYFIRLAERIAEQRRLIEAINEQVTQKQRELQEAMKRRQILEKLKEQGMERYHRELLKEEMQFIDEIAVNRYARQVVETRGGDQ